MVLSNQAESLLFTRGNNVKSGREQGAAAVEFALVLPLFLIIVFGIVEFSIALYDKAIITNASREAARAGIVLKSPKLSVGEIQNVALNYCQAHLISFGNSTVPIVSVPTGGGGDFGTPLTVSVSYKYSGFALGLLLSAFAAPFNLSATTVMNNE